MTEANCPVCANNRRFCANCESTGFVPATAPPSAPVGVEVSGYIATVPDNCDRIIWRGRYHHLPLTQQPAQQEINMNNQVIRHSEQNDDSSFDEYVVFGADAPWASDESNAVKCANAHEADKLYALLCKQPAQAAPGEESEDAKVARDVVLYGSGYMLDGKRIDPRRVQVATPPGDDAAGGGIVCVWTEQHDGEAWDGGCGAVWQFTNGGPADNDMRHCPGCGNRVETSTQKESDQ
jgi:hypothetical protein